jgi:capsular polysaccharide biosynthesis protein
MARLVLPSFAKEAIKYAGIKPEETNAMLPYYDTLKVSKIKDAELIEIKLRGPSSEMANNLMQGLIINLQKAHSKMMFDSVEKNAKQLQVLVADIQKSGVEMDVLRQRLLSSHNWSDFDASIAATLLQNKAYEVREMTQRKLMLDEQLSSTRTFTARVVDEVYVSDGPVSPRKALIIGLAILLGLVCAVVFAFGHNAIAAKSA